VAALARAGWDSGSPADLTDVALFSDFCATNFGTGAAAIDSSGGHTATGIRPRVGHVAKADILSDGPAAGIGVEIDEALNVSDSNKSTESLVAKCTSLFLAVDSFASPANSRTKLPRNGQACCGGLVHQFRFFF
jgi:hypothetical protein